MVTVMCYGSDVLGLCMHWDPFSTVPVTTLIITRACDQESLGDWINPGLHVYRWQGSHSVIAYNIHIMWSICH